MTFDPSVDFTAIVVLPAERAVIIPFEVTVAISGCDELQVN